MHLDVVSYYHLNPYGKIDHHFIDRIEIDGARRFTDRSVLDLLATHRSLALHSHVAYPVPVRSSRSPAPAKVVAEPVLLMSRSPKKTVLDIYGNIVAPSMVESLTKEMPLAVKDERKKEKSPFEKFSEWIASMKPKQCEDNYDCDRGERCCDLGFGNVCCGGGIGAVNEALSPVLVPIPVYAEEKNYPPSRPQGRNYPF